MPGVCYHVINRGNNRRARCSIVPPITPPSSTLIREAQDLIPLELFAACLMPNHFHLVAAAVRARRRRTMDALAPDDSRPSIQPAHGNVGRVWQGRYKAFPIEGGRAPDSRCCATSSGMPCGRTWSVGRATGGGAARPGGAGPSSRSALLAAAAGPTARAAGRAYVDAPQTRDGDRGAARVRQRTAALWFGILDRRLAGVPRLQARSARAGRPRERKK